MGDASRSRVAAAHLPKIMTIDSIFLIEEK